MDYNLNTNRYFNIPELTKTNPYDVLLGMAILCVFIIGCMKAANTLEYVPDKALGWLTLTLGATLLARHIYAITESEKGSDIWKKLIIAIIPLALVALGIAGVIPNCLNANQIGYAIVGIGTATFAYGIGKAAYDGIQKWKNVFS